TGTDPAHFVYEGGDPYSVEEARGRGFSAMRSCSNDVDGTSLYMLSASVRDTSQRNSKEEYKQKVQGMRDLWESQGHEVLSVGPVSAGAEIRFVTDAGTEVRYSAGEHAEIIQVQTACVLSK
ncbi:hypothetical protein ACN082_08085, partial [Rothia sp. CCM 9417]|uniref:hypothetical protein n=1 Tax=Rothia sp. CCM 9417 TaxID=3402657 RepID=UPI003AEE109E